MSYSGKKSIGRYLNSPFECGVCGTKLPANTMACPECGADDKTGLRGDTWEADASSQLGIFDEEAFDYDDFLARELRQTRSGKNVREIHSIWWLAGIVLFFALLLAALCWFGLAARALPQ